MSKSDVQIVKATVVVILPIRCSQCGRTARSQSIRLETGGGTVEELAETLAALGSARGSQLAGGVFFAAGRMCWIVQSAYTGV